MNQLLIMMTVMIMMMMNSDLISHTTYAEFCIPLGGSFCEEDECYIPIKVNIYLKQLMVEW